MIIEYDPDTPVKQQEIIRDKAFAKRLDQACQGNPHVPDRGKQKWIYDGLMERFGIRVSPEATRKWFAGVARPRPKIMSAVAQLLEVDEAWLSLGLKPDTNPEQKRVRNALVEGAVNLVAGLIQIGGGHVAFPEASRAHEADIFAIVKGRQHAIEVRPGHEIDETHVRFNVNSNFSSKTVIGLLTTDKPTVFRLVRLTTAFITAHGTRRGDFHEVVVERIGTHLGVGEDLLAEIADPMDLDGKVPRVRAPAKARKALDLE